MTLYLYDFRLNYSLLKKKGIFYDETYENVEDLASYSSEVIGRNLRKSDFQFEYTISRVYQNSSFKLTKLCMYKLIKNFVIKVI